MKKVPDMLRDAAKLYEERNKAYGDNYHQFGHVMAGMFSKGVVLKTVDDHNRFGVFVQMAYKLTRYAEHFSRGGHKDSLDDLAVYAMMLQELDAEVAAMKIVPKKNEKGIDMEYFKNNPDVKITVPGIALVGPSYNEFLEKYQTIKGKIKTGPTAADLEALRAKLTYGNEVDWKWETKGKSK